MHNTHNLDPGPQVWRALVEAGVLDEMFLALVGHSATVVPVEVVQVGVVVVGLCAGIGCAACVVFPWSTLRREREQMDSLNAGQFIFVFRT